MSESRRTRFQQSKHADDKAIKLSKKEEEQLHRALKDSLATAPPGSGLSFPSRTHCCITAHSVEEAAPIGGDAKPESQVLEMPLNRKRKMQVVSNSEADSWEKDSGAEASSSTGDEEDDIGSEYSGSEGSDDVEFDAEDESLTPGAGRRKVSNTPRPAAKQRVQPVKMDPSSTAKNAVSASAPHTGRPRRASPCKSVAPKQSRTPSSAAGKPTSKAASAGAQAKLRHPTETNSEGPRTALVPALASEDKDSAGLGSAPAVSVPALRPSLRANQEPAAVTIMPAVPSFSAKDLPTGGNAEAGAMNASRSPQNSMLAGAALAPRPFYRLGLKRPSKPLHATVNRPA